MFAYRFNIDEVPNIGLDNFYYFYINDILGMNKDFYVRLTQVMKNQVNAKRKDL